MLRYAGHDWLLDLRDSPIRARLRHGCRDAAEVHWQLDLSYVAAGSRWRRVKSWQRPSLRFCVYGFMPDSKRWNDLEGQDFASGDDNGSGGTLFLETSRLHSAGTVLATPGAHRLQFLKREGHWFTITLAVGASKPVAASHGPGRAQLVAEPSLEVIEQVAFGLVEVEAPINAANPERFARAYAAKFVGLTGPCACDFGPRLSVHDQRPISSTDWRVRLHYGAQWTHYTL